MLVFLFWFSIVGLFYIYVGYPTLIWCLARLRPSKTDRADHQESLSIVLIAYNEAANIRRKLDNLLRSSAAARIDEILVASDGSTDSTQDIVEAHPDPRVRLLHFDERRGKPAVLNDVVPMCQSEIVILTDARQELEPSALDSLAANFADESIGVVSAELVFRDTKSDSTAAQGIGTYWKYEKFIRKNEGRFRSVPGASGALYAIRKSLFQPIPPQTLLDDVVIPMQAIVAGYRCVFEDRAILFDIPSQSASQEAIRKRRTIAGVAQLILNHPSWLLPWRNPIWFEFISHKIARLFSPVLLLMAAITNVMLVTQSFYAVVLWTHIAFYFSALVGWLFQQSGSPSKLFGTQLMFVRLNATTLAALWDASRGRFSATWQKST